MNLTNKLTSQERLIRELKELKNRIDIKTKSLFNIQTIPRDRIAKGIHLSSLVEKSIVHAEKWNKEELGECISELEGQGIRVINRLG